MNRLRRNGVRPPADWKTSVDAALVDAHAFWKAARSFEKLAVYGATRKVGFISYGGHVLPVDAKGEPHFPAVWREHEPTRKAIAAMSDGLCAYCQVLVCSSHVGKGGEDKPPGQVEHFMPKSRFPMLAYTWGNYFLSCAGCNNAKGDAWPRGGYVRPDRGRPGDRFTFARTGEVTARRKKDKAAANTVKDFGLDRHWLNHHRATAIESHLRVVDMLLKVPWIGLADLLVADAVAFSAAINQNVRRAWEAAQRKTSP